MNENIDYNEIYFLKQNSSNNNIILTKSYSNFDMEDSVLNDSSNIISSEENNITNIELNDDEEENENDNNKYECYGNILEKNDEEVFINININDIKLIFKRYYYLRNTGIEIFTKNNKNYYFNFRDEKCRDLFYNSLMSLKFYKLKIIDNFMNENEKEEEEDKEDKSIILEFMCSPFYFKWDNYLINHDQISFYDLIKYLWNDNIVSNFELIMIINIFCNRSYNDLFQYPILPLLFII